MVQYDIQDVRHRVLIRDKYQCFLCERKGVQVHEIIPRSAAQRGFIYSEKNRVSLCPECHSKAHTRTERTKTFHLLVEKFNYQYSEEEKKLIKRYIDL